MDASSEKGNGIEDTPCAEDPAVYFRMRARPEDLETEDSHKRKKAYTKESLARMPSGSFGLFSDDETEDEKMRRERETETGAKPPAIIVSHSIIS